MKVDRKVESPFEQSAVFTDEAGTHTLTFDTSIVAGESWCEWYVTDDPPTLDEISVGRVDHQTEWEDLYFDCAEPVVTTEMRTEDDLSEVAAGMATFQMISGSMVRRYLTLVSARKPSLAGRAWSCTTPAGTQAGTI